MPATLLTLNLDIEGIDNLGDRPAPLGYRQRPMSESDTATLGRLYFDAYPPGIACSSVEEAIEDIGASFRGEYGQLWHEASPLIQHEGQVVAAIMTVVRAPWDDTPDCPFVIELITDPAHRRRGLAYSLVESTVVTVRQAGESGLALRVAEDNTPARTLYRGLGFDPWQP